MISKLLNESWRFQHKNGLNHYKYSVMKDKYTRRIISSLSSRIVELESERRVKAARFLQRHWRKRPILMMRKAKANFMSNIRKTADIDLREDHGV